MKVQTQVNVGGKWQWDTLVDTARYEMVQIVMTDGSILHVRDLGDCLHVNAANGNVVVCPKAANVIDIQVQQFKPKEDAK